MNYLGVIVICLLVGYILGYHHAHGVVATECRKLGKFYVGDSVFVCVEEQKVGENRKEG